LNVLSRLSTLITQKDAEGYQSSALSGSSALNCTATESPIPAFPHESSGLPNQSIMNPMMICTEQGGGLNGKIFFSSKIVVHFWAIPLYYQVHYCSCVCVAPVERRGGLTIKQEFLFR